MKSKHAFTLIELLIVVAIIAILAAIAVPNFLEAQTRAKVARVKNDLRSVATAIEAYRVDTNKYPDQEVRLGVPEQGHPVDYAHRVYHQRSAYRSLYTAEPLQPTRAQCLRLLPLCELPRVLGRPQLLEFPIADGEADRGH